HAVGAQPVLGVGRVQAVGGMELGDVARERRQDRREDRHNDQQKKQRHAQRRGAILRESAELAPPARLHLAPPHRAPLGSMNEWTRSTSRLTITIRAPIQIVKPMMALWSDCRIDCTAKVPMPGQSNTVSTITALVTSTPKIRPIWVTVEIRALRSTYFHTIRPGGMPMARW